jgi:hypothetical protein
LQGGLSGFDFSFVIQDKQIVAPDRGDLQKPLCHRRFWHAVTRSEPRHNFSRKI